MLTIDCYSSNISFVNAHRGPFVCLCSTRSKYPYPLGPPMGEGHMKLFTELMSKDSYNPRDKGKVREQHVRYMLNRTQSMFRYQGLPETIPERMIELYLQCNGHLCFAKWGESLYVYTGGLGGEPDVYYMPTLYTVANPAQGWSKSLRIDTDCVVMPNDSLYIGLLPLFNRYAYAMAENELSLHLADINSRIVGLISAADDRTMSSAKKYLEDIESGKLGIIGENAFLDGVRAQPYAMSGSKGIIQDLIEYEQYLKASWFNDLGLDSNYNMKRERLSSSETAMNEDCLLPLVDDMLKCRRLALEKVNDLFGTDIRVSLSSAWEDNQEQVDITTQMLKEKMEGGDMERDSNIDRGEVDPDVERPDLE